MARRSVTGEQIAQIDNPDPFASPVWRSPVYRTPEGVIWLVQLLRLLWRAIWFLITHPLLDAVAGVVALIWLNLRPVGNIRKVAGGGNRLRFRRNGEMRTSPQVYRDRAAAERALRKMADDGGTDCSHDRRFRALVLLATFASLRWGEVIALRRCDLELEARTVRIRAAVVERSTGELLIGPPKSKAGRRVVGIPSAIIPALHEHLATFVKGTPGALVFPGVKGGLLRRSNFNKMSGGPTR